MTLVQRILATYAHAHVACGLVALAVALFWRPWEASPAALMVTCILGLAATAAGRFEFEFQFGGRSIYVDTCVVPRVLAVAALEPRMAVLVALAEIGFRRGLKSLMMEVGSVAGTVGASAWLIHTFVTGSGGATIVLSGLLGAVLCQLFQVACGLAYLESREQGAAGEHFRDSAVVSGYELFLPTLGVAAVVPFVGSPMAFALALVLFLAATVMSLKVMKSEQVHREQSVFLRATFSRYVPSSVVDQLTDEEASTSLGGEERDITVMFVDVRNFTGWSEHLTPREVVGELNQLMTELTQAVFDTGGTLDKFTGDGLMAFWGAPVVQPDHPARALRAAADMLARTDAFNAARSGAGGHQLKIGVGIHTGPAIVGNIGHVDRMDYTAIGDTVNVSARLEAATKEVGCDAIASGVTADRLVDSPEFAALRRVGALSVKGRTEAVEAWALVPEVLDGMVVPDTDADVTAEATDVLAGGHDEGAPAVTPAAAASEAADVAA